ncbi:MAG: hypothetical protein HY820_06645 [Acidobacteria bacterium]|nr:hypothetical protein [Acidobacteriota bacterium]
MATDWKMIAESRRLEATPTQMETYASILGALELQMSELKQGLAYDAEPATFPQPVVGGEQ